MFPTVKLVDRSTPSTSIADAFTAIAAGLDAARDAALSAVSEEELADLLVEGNVLSSRLDALRARLTARATLVLTGPGTGNRSAAQLVGKRSNADLQRCRHDARLGSWLADFPVFADAFAAGVINQGHLRLLRSADNFRTHRRMVEAQEFLVDTAAEVSLKQFEQVVGYWLLGADPDGELPEHQLKKTGCSYRTNGDGTVDGRFHLDPVSGQAFITAMEQEGERLHRQHTEAGVHRTRYQRMGEALTRLVSRGAARPDGTVPAPLVSVVMSERVAEAVIAAMAAGAAPKSWPTDPLDVDGRCEFLDGTPLHPYHAARILAVAQFRRYVFNAKGRVVEASASARTFPKWMRHILLLQSRGRCGEAGCDAPLAWLHADHIHPASKGGPTRLANGQMLCGPHNRLKADHTTNHADGNAA